MSPAAGVHVRTTAPAVDADGLRAAVREAARAAGVEAYFVGGAVRDRLLGRGVGHDVDIVTLGGERGGIELLSHLARLLGWRPPLVFERFGTGQVRGDGFIVEAVRARAERYDPTSRRPEVRPGSLAEDMWRRDFTINALCQDLDGRILDLCGRGLDDLWSGVLRTPLDPEDTFAEDPLRMLRMARFVAQLGFRPAPGMLEACHQQAERLSILSVERVRDELRRLLVADDPQAGLAALHGGGLLDAILPELAAAEGVEQSGYHDDDVLHHTFRAVGLAPPDVVTRTAALLHDVGKPPTHRLDERGRHTFHGHSEVGAEMAVGILDRLRYPNDEIHDIRHLVRLHLRPIQYEAGTHSDAAVRRLIAEAGPLRERLLDLARADTLASTYPGTAAIDELGERMARLDSGGAIRELRPPLDGHALQARLGRGPGRWIGRLQARLRDEVLEGTLPAGDAEAAWRWLELHPDVVDAVEADPGL